MPEALNIDALIVGGSGFLGARLAHLLGERGLATYCARPLANEVRFDATRERLADLLARMDRRFTHVVILYGLTAPDACARDPLGSGRINVDSVIKVAEDALNAGAVPVFASSDYVFDGTQGDWRESDMAVPRVLYGAQKRAVERWLERSGAPHLVVRLSKLVNGDAESHSVLGQWVDDIRAGRTMRCAEDQFFSPTWVDDAAGALIALMRRGTTGLLHLAGRERLSRLELARMLAAAVSARDPAANPLVVPCRLNELPFLEPRPLDTSLATERLQAAIGWRFKPMQALCDEVAAAECRRRAAKLAAS